MKSEKNYFYSRWSVITMDIEKKITVSGSVVWITGIKTISIFGS